WGGCGGAGVGGGGVGRGVGVRWVGGGRGGVGAWGDCGCCVVGVRGLGRELFERIDWSTEQVFEQTGQRATQIGVRVHELPRGFDVDDRATLQRLCDEVLSENARDSHAPQTQEFLRGLIARDGRERIWPL